MPPPTPERVRLLLAESVLATCKVSVPAPPSRVMVVLATPFTVVVSLPPPRLMVSKLVKLVVPSVPLPLPDIVTLLFAPSKLRVSLPNPPARLVALPPVLIVASSLPAPRSTEPLKAAEKVAVSLLVSELAARLMVSNPLTVRLESSVMVPLLATLRLLTPLVALRESLPLPPTRLSKPVTVPLMPVAPPEAMELALSSVTDTALLEPA